VDEYTVLVYCISATCRCIIGVLPQYIMLKGSAYDQRSEPSAHRVQGDMYGRGAGVCKCNKRRFRRNLPYDRSRIRPGPGRGTPCAPPKDRQIKCAWHASTSIAPMDPAPNVAVSLTSPWPEPRRRLRGVQHAAGPTATTHAMCIQSDCVRVEVLDLHASAPHLILSGSGVTYRHRQQKISTTQKMGSTQRLSFASPLAQYTTAVALSVKCADMVNLWLSGTFEARNVALRSRASGCQPLSNSEARDEMRPHGQQPTQTPGLCRQSRCHYVAIV
jgi:hypothetical protein